MAVKPIVTQMRYYGIGNSENFPNTEGYWYNGENLAEPKNLLSDYGPAIKIGIQTLPGTAFHLNDSSDKIIIDHTGIYELDLRDTTITINTLFFEPLSLIAISAIDNASLIVDILYYPQNGGGSNQ